MNLGIGFSKLKLGCAIKETKLKNTSVGLSQNPNIVAGLLMVAYLLSFLDRQILVLMIEPIQRDLDISDTQFSLLHGTSFAFFYAIAGLFMGRLVDNHNRVKIISVSIFLWSIATAVCGLSRTFYQLFFARMFVGVGEAGLSPGTFSLLSDLFKPEHRARAFSIYAMGIYLGSGLAFMFGGHLIATLEAMPPLSLPVLGSVYSWQVVLLIVGLPGILLSLIIYRCIKEPVRGAQESIPLESADNVNKEQSSNENPATFRDFLTHYRKEWRAYTGHNLGFGLHMMFSYSFMAWLPVLFMRIHGWTITEIGYSIGLLILICGPLGAMTGGYLSEWLLRRGVSDSQLRICSLGSLTYAGFGALAAGTQNTTVALIAAGACFFFMGFPGGLNSCSLQTITPPRLRGQASAFFLLVGSILGLALGPLCVALLTDYVFADKNQVHYSLQIFSIVCLPLSALLLWRTKNYFRIPLEPNDLVTQ